MNDLAVASTERTAAGNDRSARNTTAAGTLAGLAASFEALIQGSALPAANAFHSAPALVQPSPAPRADEARMSSGADADAENLAESDSEDQERSSEAAEFHPHPLGDPKDLPTAAIPPASGGQADLFGGVGERRPLFQSANGATIVPAGARQGNHAPSMTATAEIEDPALQTVPARVLLGTRSAASQPAARPSAAPSFTVPLTAAPLDAGPAVTASLGGTNRLPGTQGEITVSKRADVLYSQPPSFLSPSAVAGVEAAKPRSPQSATKGNAANRVQGRLQGMASHGGGQTGAEVGSQTSVAPPVPTAVNGGLLPAGRAPASVVSAGGGQSGTVSQPGGEASAADPMTGSAGSALHGAKSVARATRAPVPRGSLRQQTINEQVRVHITKALAEGVDRINIRLKPASLGSVDIRLELSRDGRVAATISADNRHTLELLRSDGPGLERALQDAGLKAHSGSLTFTFRGGDSAPHGSEQRASDTMSELAAKADADDEDLDHSRAIAAGAETAIIGDGRVDIRA